MLKTIIINLIASINCFLLLTACEKNIQKNTNSFIECESLKETSLIKEESYSYFEFKFLVEEFPFYLSNPTNYYREYIKSTTSKKAVSTFRSFPKWTSVGPSNIAGRSLCLGLNPLDTNQIWMGSAGSGLWKSTKGGIGSDAWQYVATGFPVISVSSIAIQANNPNILYIGTGEIYNYEGADGGIHTRTLRGSRGIGILKSLDGGIHWNLSLDWTLNSQTAIWKIIIHPLDPNIVFAATNVGVYKTIDGGNNWMNVLDLPLAMDLIIDHSEPNNLYTAIGGINGTHYGVYKSINEGDTWSLVASPNDTLYNGRIMLANYKKNPKRVIAAYSDNFKTISMLRSKDGFQNNFYLNIKDVCDHQGWYAKCLHIKDDDSSKIIMGGVDLYLDSSGTGNQLFNLLSRRIKIHADFHDIISNPYDPDKIYIATDGGLYRSNDFAQTFYSCNEGFVSAQFYTGNISTISGNLLGGLQDNRSVISNKSNLWKGLHYGDGTYNYFHPKNDSILYISSQYQNLFKSVDGGFSWKELIKPNVTASFVSPFILHPNDPSKIYSGGNHLFISNDSGNTWDTSKLSSTNEYIVALETPFQNKNLIYISTLDLTSRKSHLYISQDGGIQLQSKEEGIPERFIRDICIDPRNSNSLYIALGGTGQPGVMRSTDAALSWFFPVNQYLPDVPFHSIMVDPFDSDILYAACDFGLYVSLNKGNSWYPYNTHSFDLVPVYDIKYSSVENKLILFTHGYGAFSCSLLDKSLVTENSNLYSLEGTINILNELIVIPTHFGIIKNLFLINVEGRMFCLEPTGIGFLTNDLPAGIYFIVSRDPTLNGFKILIIR